MLRVYGSSDDLIEIDGDINEEFVYDGEGGFLAFSDGTLLAVEYSDTGIWRFGPLNHGSAEYANDAATEDDGHRDNYLPAYSDIVTLQGDFLWVVYGRQRGKRSRA